MSRIHPAALSPLLREKIQAARDGLDNSEYQIRLLFENRAIKHVRGISRMVEHKDGRIECIGATAGRDAEANSRKTPGTKAGQTYSM